MATASITPQVLKSTAQAVQSSLLLLIRLFAEQPHTLLKQSLSPSSNNNQQLFSIHLFFIKFFFSSGSTNFDASSLSFTYDTAVSPTVISVSPNSGVSGSITITGTNFGSDQSKVSVKVGTKSCVVSSASATSIQCTLSEGSAGIFPVVVSLSDVGNSNSDIKYTYQLAITQLSKSQGSIGGGLGLQITGTGFSSNTNVTICDQPCPLQQESTSTSITCTVCFFLIFFTSFIFCLVF